MNKNKYVIIGSSAVAIGAINRLLRVEPEADVTVISKEKELPYNKCFLVDKLSNQKVEAELYTKPANYFEDKGIQLVLGREVVKIDRAIQQVLLDDGSAIDYNKLLLGMGSSPYRLQLEGCDAEGVFYFHTMKDLAILENYITKVGAKRAVIVGAGFTGLECADALHALGLQIAVVERGSQLLPRHLDEGASNFVTNKMKQKGVDLRFTSEVDSIQIRENKAIGVKLSCGSVLPADIIILAAGVRPNVGLAKMADLSLEDGYLKVNQYLQTSDPDIFAGGDLIKIKDLLTGKLVPSCMWKDAMLQGSYAGLNMASNKIEAKKAYSGALMVAETNIFGLDIVSCGSFEAGNLNQSSSFYKKVDQENGFILVGCRADFISLRRQLATQIAL